MTELVERPGMDLDRQVRLPPSSGLRITVLGDDEEFASVLRETFELVFDAVELTELRLTRTSVSDVASTEPDLMVADVGMDGVGLRSPWELLEQSRREAPLAGIPLLLMSADQRGLEGRAAVFASGRTVILAKPFSLDEPVAAVRELCSSLTTGDARLPS
jgi:CheY-like chemotaxis protein